MTPFEKRQSPFTKRMIEEMQIRGLADSTIDSYSYHVDRFASFIGKKPENANQEEIRNFQLWMKNELQSSWSQFNQAVSALRWFYTFVYKRDWTVRMIPFGHVPKKLPNVLGYDEVCRLLQCVQNPKHHAALATMYAAGLRVRETTQLKIHDIDSARMMIKIVQGKGGKDRYVPLSPKLLTTLREYYKINKPSEYLFPEKTPDTPLHSAVLQDTCKLASAEAKLINKHRVNGSLTSAKGDFCFNARSKEKNRALERYSLRSIEFVQQWSLHILPKGFQRSRFFGGWSGAQRKAYQEQVEQLMRSKQGDSKATNAQESVRPMARQRCCPRCAGELIEVESVERPSWWALNQKKESSPASPNYDARVGEKTETPEERGRGSRASPIGLDWIANQRGE